MHKAIPCMLLLLIGTTAAHAAANCTIGPAAAAAVNAASLETMVWAPFGRSERGWATYATRIGIEIGAKCAAQSAGFADALAQWQQRQRLPATGVLDTVSFSAMNRKWTLARPFVVQRQAGICPPPPPSSALATTSASESYGGKTIELRADALAAYRMMVASAQRSLPSRDPNWFTIFSGFRDPADDAVRCTAEGNCQGIVRAACSAHRTGLAIDLHMGTALGFGPDSSNDINRRAMVHTMAYRWMLTNAARFGFVNYAFEPWHWEWSPPEPQYSDLAQPEEQRSRE